MDFFGLNVSNIVLPKKRYNMPTEKGEKCTVDLASILHWIKSGELWPYWLNRGDGSIAPKTFKSILSGIKPSSFEVITVGYWLNEAGELVLTIANGNTRMAAVIKLVIDGNITAEELAMEVHFSVVHDFIEAYRQVNNQSTHRSKDKVANPDLAYGHALHNVLNKTGNQCRSLIGKSKSTPLSSLVYTTIFDNNKDQTWFWPDVYRNRAAASKLTNEAAGTLVIPAEHEKNLANGILYWYKVVCELEARGKSGHIKVNSITNSAGFFGFLVCKWLQFGENKVTKPALVCNRVFRNLTKVTAACPELCRGNRDVVLRYTTELNRVLDK